VKSLNQLHLMAACGIVFAAAASAQESAVPDDPSLTPLHVYQLTAGKGAESYEEAMAVACFQGLVNRDAPLLYVLSTATSRPQYWLDTFAREGGWLAGRRQEKIADLNALRALAGDRVKGAVIWDPEVAATVNVATTIAGVEDAVVLSPELAERYLPQWNLPVLHDLRGRFDGKESGSAKNDAYRWAIREYLAKGRCSSRLLCLFEDAAKTRESGDTSYVVTRDWAVHRRAFVFDLSPWGDERPKDDPEQPLGTDLATYRQILEETLKHSAGKHMTELTGFFAFWKYSAIPGYESRHEPVPTEWETVWLISPYNAYQNTISSDCFNQSLHSQAPAPKREQRRPALRPQVEDKAYVCILMADYDSATPLYDFLPRLWEDAGRGKVPLAWGINPNLPAARRERTQWRHAVDVGEKGETAPGAAQCPPLKGVARSAGGCKSNYELRMKNYE
jgi:hypothetical protein